MPVPTPTAYLCGTNRQPEVWLFFDRHAVHAGSGKPLVDWVKSAPGRRWNPEARCWVLNGFGPKDPEALLRAAGFVFSMDARPPGLPSRDPSLSNVLTLSELTPPLVRMSPIKAGVALVRPRFAGWTMTRDLLGGGASWDRATGRFEVRLTDLLIHGDPRPGIVFDDGNVTIEAARAALIAAPTFQHSRHDDEAILASAAEAAFSTGVTRTDAIDMLVDVVGDVPEWLGMTPFPYQRVGALALCAGRTFLADPAGLGKGSPESSKILTPTGWTTYGEIKVGDAVIGSNGRAISVTGVYPRGELPVFRVTFNDDATVVVDGDHLWQTQTDVERREGRHPSVKSTREIMAEGFRRGDSAANGRHLHYIPMVEPVQFAANEEPLPLDPYVLGILLGDGSFAQSGVTNFCTADDEVVEEIGRRLPDRHKVSPTEWAPGRRST